MALPRISIVTPSFNQVAYVEETIRSVLDQGYENLEYLVLDGGSTDGSVGILEKYRSSFHYFVSERDAGHADALNKGFARSTGEIMAWINSDDKYVPWTFQTVAAIFEEHPDVNWIVGTDAVWNDKGAMIAAYDVYTNVLDYLAGDFKRRMIQAESVFWRRSLWERAGGYISRDYKLMIDTELWTRFFRLEPLWHAHCILSGFRMHGENRSLVALEESEAETRHAIEIMRQHIDLANLGPVRSNYPMLRYDRQSSRWTKQVARRQAKTQ